MMKHTALTALIFFASFLPVYSGAHSSGEAFTVISGEYSEDSPIYGASPDKIPQDFLKQTFVVGTPVEFKIDTHALGFAADARWKWGQGNGNYEEGSPIRHSFDRPGSYWVYLQVKGEQTSGQWADYDNIQVNVVPDAGYKLPSVKSVIQVKESKDGHHATLTALPTPGSAAITKYDWVLGDGERAQGKTVRHTYPKGISRAFPVLVVTDANGLQASTAFQIDDSGGPLVASSLEALPDAVTTIHTGSQWGAWVLVRIAILIAVLAGIIFFRRRQLRAKG